MRGWVAWGRMVPSAWGPSRKCGSPVVKGLPAGSCKGMARWVPLVLVVGLLCMPPLYTIQEGCGLLEEELHCGLMVIWGPSPSEWWWAI